MSRRWRRHARARLARFSSQQLAQAVWLGLIIGVVAGLGAIVFFEMIAFATEHLLSDLTGYVPPEPLGEVTHTVEASDPTRLWALPIVLGLGGLVAGIIVFRFAPEAEGHGTDAAIESFHHNAGRTRLRAIPVKLVASAITIGSGGAAGREGPTAQVGAGFGSFIATRLGLGAMERRKALAAGMGAGIGAIFRAPLGGAMMGAEVLYKNDFEADVILLSLISSIVAFTVYGAYFDYTPIFQGTAGFAFSDATELPYYAGVGIICGLMGILYARTFYGVVGIFKRIPLPLWAKPAIGGVLVGAIGMGIPEAIHVGYGFIQESFTIEEVVGQPMWLLLALPFARIITTSLSVGSGGSGGIFGPGMVIGGVTGAVIWRLGNGLPGFPADPGPVVIIAMIAMFGSIAHAPLAMLLMVAEMTGNLSLLAPAMVAVALATLLVGDQSIYENQLETRADSPAHRDRFAFPLLSALPAHRAVAPIPILEHHLTPSEAIEALTSGRSPYGVVVDDHGALLGEITADILRSARRDGTSSISRLVRPIPATVNADTPLDQALDQLANQERRWLPVVDGKGGPVLGAIDTRALLRSYRRAMKSNVRPLAPVSEDLHSVEIVLPEDSPLAGVTLAASGIPPGARILTVERDGHVIVPHGGTRLEPGDTLTLSFPAAQRRRIFSIVLGS